MILLIKGPYRQRRMLESHDLECKPPSAHESPPKQDPSGDTLMMEKYAVT
jgi:hypothetical protein